MRASIIGVLTLAVGALWVGCGGTTQEEAAPLQDMEQQLQICTNTNPTCPPGYYCTGLPRGTCVPENPPLCGKALPCPPGYHCNSDVRGVCYPD